MQDRRETDKIILDRLDKQSDTFTQIKVDLALNTQSTQKIEEHLKTLNGKVAAHEARMQIVEGAQAITSTAVAQIQTREEKQNGKVSSWLDWLLKGVAVVALTLFYYLLTHAGNFPDFLN